MSCSAGIQQADPHVKNPHIRNSLNIFCVKMKLARNISESVVLPSWAVTDRYTYFEDGLWVDILDFDWLVVSPLRRILTTGLKIFITRVKSGHTNLEPRMLIVMVLFFMPPCVLVRFVLSESLPLFCHWLPLPLWDASLCTRLLEK